MSERRSKRGKFSFFTTESKESKTLSLSLSNAPPRRRSGSARRRVLQRVKSLALLVLSLYSWFLWREWKVERGCEGENGSSIGGRPSRRLRRKTEKERKKSSTDSTPPTLGLAEQTT